MQHTASIVPATVQLDANFQTRRIRFGYTSAKNFRGKLFTIFVFCMALDTSLKKIRCTRACPGPSLCGVCFGYLGISEIHRSVHAKLALPNPVHKISASARLSVLTAPFSLLPSAQVDGAALSSLLIHALDRAVLVSALPGGEADTLAVAECCRISCSVM